MYHTGWGGLSTETECDLAFYLVVRDLVANRELAIPPPPPLRNDVLTASDVTVGPDGRVVAGLTTELGGCGQPPLGATYVLDGNRWRLLARNATWAATSPDGRLATIDPDRVLRIDGHRVATRVRLAAWSPR